MRSALVPPQLRLLDAKLLPNTLNANLFELPLRKPTWQATSRRKGIYDKSLMTGCIVLAGPCAGNLMASQLFRDNCFESLIAAFTTPFIANGTVHVFGHVGEWTQLATPGT